MALPDEVTRNNRVIDRAEARSRAVAYPIHVIEELGELGCVSDAYVRRHPRAKILATFKRGRQVG